MHITHPELILAQDVLWAVFSFMVSLVFLYTVRGVEGYAKLLMWGIILVAVGGTMQHCYWSIWSYYTVIGETESAKWFTDHAYIPIVSSVLVTSGYILHLRSFAKGLYPRVWAWVLSGIAVVVFLLALNISHILPV